MHWLGQDGRKQSALLRNVLMFLVRRTSDDCISSAPDKADWAGGKLTWCSLVVIVSGTDHFGDLFAVDDRHVNVDDDQVEI